MPTDKISELIDYYQWILDKNAKERDQTSIESTSSILIKEFIKDLHSLQATDTKEVEIERLKEIPTQWNEMIEYLKWEKIIKKMFVNYPSNYADWYNSWIQRAIQMIGSVPTRFITIKEKEDEYVKVPKDIYDKMNAECTLAAIRGWDFVSE